MAADGSTAAEVNTSQVSALAASQLWSDTVLTEQACPSHRLGKLPFTVKPPYTAEKSPSCIYLQASTAI